MPPSAPIAALAHPGPEACRLTSQQWAIAARRARAHRRRSRTPHPYFDLVRDERAWGAIGWDPETSEPAAIFLTPPSRPQVAHLPWARRQAALVATVVVALAAACGLFAMGVVLGPDAMVLAMVGLGMCMAALGFWSHEHAEVCTRLTPGVRADWAIRIRLLDERSEDPAGPGAPAVREALWDWQTVRHASAPGVATAIALP